MSVPKLRFSEFSQGWKPAKAGDAFNSRRTKGEEGIPIYSVTLDRGMIRRDTLDRQILDDAADGANLRAQQGDLVYNMMRMWQGAVGLAPEDCMISPAYVVLAPKAQTSAEFFNHWFKSKRMIYLLWAYSQGLTSDRLRLYFKDFAQIPLFLPSLAEQTKIAKFLTAVDEKITQLTQKCDLLKQYKKGVMQQVFSQELRFKDDEGKDFPAWESSTLIDLSENGFTNGVFNDSNKVGRGYKLINVLDMYIDSTIDESRLSLLELSDAEFIKNKVENGDIFFTRSSLVKDGIAYSNVYLGCSQNITFDGHLIRMRPNKEKLDSTFTNYLLRTSPVRKQLVERGKTATMTTIGQADIAAVVVQFPCLAEQTKIANFLTAIDAKITNAQAQLTTAKQYKQGLLQQMFV